MISTQLPVNSKSTPTTTILWPKLDQMWIYDLYLIKENDKRIVKQTQKTVIKFSANTYIEKPDWGQEPQTLCSLGQMNCRFTLTSSGAQEYYRSFLICPQTLHSVMQQPIISAFFLEQLPFSCQADQYINAKCLWILIFYYYLFC